MPLPFTVTDVYKHLKRTKVQQIPRFLSAMKDTPTLFRSKQQVPTHPKQDNDTGIIASSVSTETIASDMTTPDTYATQLEPDPNLLIDGLVGTVVEDCVNPVMYAQIRPNNRSRCQACLLGFHSEMKCYLRGPAFQPDELKRRIRVYN